jgi:hypothetical protein
MVLFGATHNTMTRPIIKSRLGIIGETKNVNETKEIYFN